MVGQYIYMYIYCQLNRERIEIVESDVSCDGV